MKFHANLEHESQYVSQFVHFSNQKQHEEIILHTSFIHVQYDVQLKH